MARTKEVARMNTGGFAPRKTSCPGSITKKRRTTNDPSLTPTADPDPSQSPAATDDETDEDSTNGDESTVFFKDSDLLDCPICTEPLSSPVYQCKNGHLACERCCINIKKKCASCAYKIGVNRCRAMESVVETAETLCKNYQYGCIDKIRYNTKIDHEKNCKYVPFSCPYPSCDYVDISESLYTHFSTQHKNSSKPFTFNETCFIILSTNDKQVFLQESDADTLFILNRSVEPSGSLVHVVCIAHELPKGGGYMYKLRATVGETTINLKSVAEHTSEWTTKPPVENYLMIPSYFIQSGGFLDLEVIIWKD